MKRLKKLHLRYNDDEIAAVKAKAEEASMYTNEFVLKLCSDINVTVERKSVCDEKALALLKRTAGNFNQIATQLNTSVKYMKPVNPNRVLIYLDLLHKDLRQIMKMINNDL